MVPHSEDSSKTFDESGGKGINRLWKHVGWRYRGSIDISMDMLYMMNRFTRLTSTLTMKLSDYFPL